MSDESTEHEPAKGDLRAPAWVWPVAACVLSCVPVAGGLSNSQVFCYRDLVGFFWPFHTWIRDTVMAGHLPLWDPYSGCGYPVIADPTTQVLFFPTLPLRLLLPAALGFNLAVALALPVAALGVYLLLRRRVSGPAAALGAVVFSVSGSVVSTANMPNLAWSVALIGWVLWRTDAATRRVSARNVAALGIVFGVQALAGEPVTFAATSVVALAYAMVFAEGDGVISFMKVGAAVVGAGILGVALSAVEMYPLVDVLGRSVRGATGPAFERALHPAGLLELIAPGVFGTPFRPLQEHVSWYQALAEGQLPLLTSIYVGVPAAVLAFLGVPGRDRRRETYFWAAVGGGALICALGSHALLYSFLSAHIPVVRSFRFPSKYIVFLPLALGALAARGWSSLDGDLATSPRQVASAVALGAGAAATCIVVWTTAFAPSASRALAEASGALGIAGAAVEGERMTRVLVSAAAHVAVVSVVAAGLLFLVRASAFARWVQPLFFVLIAADLIGACAGLNPTLDAAYFAKPEWATHVSSNESRAVVSSAGALSLESGLSPAAHARVPGELSSATIQELYAAEFPATTCGIRVGTAFYPGIPALRFREYDRIGAFYARWSESERLRAQERACVRYFVVTGPAPSDSTAVERIPDFGGVMTLYERPECAPRVGVVRNCRVVADVDEEILKTFQGPDTDVVYLATEPPAPVGDGNAAPPAASILGEQPDAMTVKASAADGGGFLLVRDTFDPNWRATVDGVEAPVMRANAIFRAVRIGPGEHTVVLRYSSRPLQIGGVVSIVAVLTLIALMIVGRRGQREAAA